MIILSLMRRRLPLYSLYLFRRPGNESYFYCHSAGLFPMLLLTRSMAGKGAAGFCADIRVILWRCAALLRTRFPKRKISGRIAAVHGSIYQQGTLAGALCYLAVRSGCGIRGVLFDHHALWRQAESVYDLLGGCAVCIGIFLLLPDGQRIFWALCSPYFLHAAGDLSSCLCSLHWAVSSANRI